VIKERKTYFRTVQAWDEEAGQNWWLTDYARGLVWEGTKNVCGVERGWLERRNQ